MSQRLNQHAHERLVDAAENALDFGASFDAFMREASDAYVEATQERARLVAGDAASFWRKVGGLP